MRKELTRITVLSGALLLMGGCASSTDPATAQARQAAAARQTSTLKWQYAKREADRRAAIDLEALRQSEPSLPEPDLRKPPDVVPQG